MAAFHQTQTSLSLKDFSLFHSLFCHEINQQLPVSGTVLFLDKEGKFFAREQVELLIGQGNNKFQALCADLEPAVINDVLVLPLGVEDADNIAAIISDIDPDLLQKMAPEWLFDLRNKVQNALIAIKQAYIYPETRLYTSRLLNLFWNGCANENGVFFLIGAQVKTRRITDGLMKIMQTARLLEDTVSGPVFYFGGNVFGLYQRQISRDNALHFARRLLGRLKREGLQHVHVGIDLIHKGERKTVERVLDNCWQALETAERRGPFSLCEVSFLNNPDSQPLSLPPRETVRKLQNKWRGLERFALVLVRVEEIDTARDREDTTLMHLIRTQFQRTYFSVPLNAKQCYLLLPDATPQMALQLSEEIKEKLDNSLQSGQVAVGISYWPCEDFFKTATIVNCRKSLMHGDFFGKGSVTVFDYLSLNVSGDHFFDEGDYRQAVREYKAGFKMNPDDINLLNSLGVALTELNRLREAIGYFDQVLVKESNNFMALVNKGFALRMLKKKEEALRCLSEATKCREFSSSPVSLDIALQLGRLYCESAQQKQAVLLLEKMKSRSFEKTGYLFFGLLGEAYAAIGKNGKAIAALQEAIRYNPHDAKSLSLLGDLYGAEEQGDDIALALCTQAVNIDDRAWENWYRLAKIRCKVADYEGAQVAIRESMQRNRKDVDVIFLAGKIFMKHGNKKRAKQLFQKVLRIAPDYPGAFKAL